MTRGDEDDTVLVYVYGERVRLGADRPAAYLKQIADAPADRHVAYREEDQLFGLRDTARVATYVADGSQVSFQPRDRLATIRGEQPAEPTQSRPTIYVNGQPVVVETTTTVGDLRALADIPDHTVAMVRDHDIGQLYTLTDADPVLDAVPPGGAIAFCSEPRQ